MTQQSLFERSINTAERYMFHYVDRKDISIHESTISNKALFYSRVFSCLFLSGIYVWAIAVVQQSLFQNVMYLTMIGYFTAWMYFTLTLQDYFLSYCNIRSHKLHQYVQIIHEIGVCVEVPITLVFWGFLFNIVLGMSGVTTEIIVINGFLHSAPLVCLSIDFVLNHFSFHINHLPVIIAFDVFYLIINLSYSLSVKPIYKPIDWVSVGSFIIAVSSIVITVLIHFIGRVVHRRWKSKRHLQHTMSQQLLTQSSESRRSQQQINLPQRDTPLFTQKIDL